MIGLVDRKLQSYYWVGGPIGSIAREADGQDAKVE